MLIDTSVWIDHFRSTVPELVRSLHEGLVVTHPFVIGELAVGHLRNRAETLGLLAELPGLPLSAHDDVLRFIEVHDLSATGIGWVDAHLLCATAAAGVPVWTRDVTLRKQAARCGFL